MHRRDFMIRTSQFVLTTGGLMGGAFGQAALVKSKGVYSAPGLSFAALSIASNANLWSANGLDIDLRQVQKGDKGP